MTGAAVDNSRTLVRSSSDTPEQAYEPRSAQAGRHPVGIRRDHRTPHRDDLFTLGESFVDGPAIEIGEGMIGGETPRVRRPERLLQAPPEIRQPHGQQLTHPESTQPD